ncbi:MAG: MarR family winged helix-turn-helix transcriptional regulator [Bacillota bacterium]
MPVTNEEIARQLLLFMSNTRRWFVRRLGEHPHGENPFSEARFRILHVIAEKKSLKMSDLSKLCHVTKGSLTVTLNKLVEDGYVERFAEPGDRRVVLVRLTPAGREYLQKTRQLLVARMSEAFTGMPETKKKKLLALLAELTEIFA